MVYLNTQYIDSPQLNGFLAHEFTHLITFNQKEKAYGVSEDVWLNEARADYTSTLLGYDDSFEGSNLQARVKQFLDKPTDSLIVWDGKKYDYGVVNIFIQYLVENYGKEILTSSISSKKIGIDSLNEALKKKGFAEDTAQIFKNWTVAVLTNDCSRTPKYCFKNSNLSSVKVVPQLNFLPMSGESSLQFTNASYDWSANWYKIVGGKGKLILEFNGQNEGKFSLIYLLCDFQDKCQVKSLSLDAYQVGEIVLEDFSKNYQSLTIIPTIQTENSESDEAQPTYLFTWKVSSVEKTEEEKEAELITNLLAQIDFLKKEIARIQAEINAKLGGGIIVCSRLENNLYYGMVDNMGVRCLQQFLKSQGIDIYPEGTISGNFWSKTQLAVIRFQEKYASEILAPTGLEKGTGYVGLKTREKINQLSGK
jgi:peptidoglycan hydrolase-like protein with peptidoglycan-binding domain